MGRRKKKAPTFVVGESQEFPASVEQGFEPAYVQIGGVRITNHGLSWPQQASAGDVSRKHQRQQQHPPWRSRRSRQQRRSSPNSSSDEGHDDDDGKVGCSSDRLDEALQDYLDNVLRGAGGSGSSEDCGGDGAKRGSGRGGSGRRSGAATHRGLQGRRDGARLPAVSRDKEESSEAELRVPVRGRGICVRLSDNEEEEDDQRSMPDDDDEDEEEEEEECEREGVDGGFGEGGGGDEELEDLRESEEEEVYGDAAMLHRLLYGFAGRDLGESEGEEESGGRGNLYEALLASKLHSDTDDSEEDKAVEKHCTEDEDEGLSYSQWIGLGHHRRRRQAHQPHRGAGGRGKEPVRSGTVNYYYEYQYDSEGKEKVVVVEASPEAVAVPSKLLVSQRAAGSSREDQTRQRNQKVSKDSISIASTKQLRCGAADCGSTGDVGAGDRHGRGVRAEAAGGIDVRSDRHDSGPGNPQRVGIGGEAVAAVAAVEAAAVAGAGESEEEAGIARTPVLEAHVSRFPFVMRSREQVRAAAAATAATLMAISATGGATPAAPRSGRNRQQEQYQPYQLQQPRQRSVVRGALNGALRPGEKKKLKKEKMQAKRAAREAVRGFDVERVAEQIADFVSSEGDMLALEPLGSYGTAVAQSLAGVYGLKHSIQGARKHKFLLLQPTDRTKAPDEATRDKVDKIVTAEISRQRRGAAAGAGVGAAGMALQDITPSSVAAARRGGAAGKAKKGGGGRGASAAGAAGAGGTPQSLEGGKRHASRYSQPVAFVRSGVQRDGGSGSSSSRGSSSRGSSSRGSSGSESDSDSSSSREQSQDEAAAATAATGRAWKDAEEEGEAHLGLGAIDAQREWLAAAFGGLGFRSHPVEESPVESRLDDVASLGNHGSRSRQASPARGETPFGGGGGGGGSNATAGAAAARCDPPVIQSDGVSYFRAHFCLGLGYDAEERQIQTTGHAGVGVYDRFSESQPWRFSGRSSRTGLGFRGPYAAVTAEPEGAEQQQHQQEEEVGEEVRGVREVEMKAANGDYGDEKEAGPGDADAEFDAAMSDRGNSETLATPPLPDKDTGNGEWRVDRRRRGKGPSATSAAAGGGGSGCRSGRKGHTGGGAAATIPPPPPPLLGPMSSTAPSVAGSALNRTAQQVKAAERSAGKKARRQLRQQQQQYQLLQPLLPDSEPLLPDRSPGLGLGVAPASLTYEFASFERHGTGIGSRLMGRMGWTQGEGLGRARQGRAEPLRAFLRPKALGLGADG